MSESIYLYGFVPPDVESPEGLLGVGGAPVEVVAAGGVGVVIGRVAAPWRSVSVSTASRGGASGT